MRLRKQKHLKLITARPSGKVRYYTKETIKKEDRSIDWDHMYHHTQKEKETAHKNKFKKIINKSKLSLDMREHLKCLSIYKEAYFNLFSMLFLYQTDDTKTSIHTEETVQLEQVV